MSSSNSSQVPLSNYNRLTDVLLCVADHKYCGLKGVAGLREGRASETVAGGSHDGLFSGLCRCLVLDIRGKCAAERPESNSSVHRSMRVARLIGFEGDATVRRPKTVCTWGRGGPVPTPPSPVSCLRDVLCGSPFCSAHCPCAILPSPTSVVATMPVL